MLKQQRDDYEQAVTAVNALTEKLEEAREELDLRRREADESRRRFNTAARENERMNVQVGSVKFENQCTVFSQ